MNYEAINDLLHDMYEAIKHFNLEVSHDEIDEFQEAKAESIPLDVMEEKVWCYSNSTLTVDVYIQPIISVQYIKIPIYPASNSTAELKAKALEETTVSHGEIEWFGPSFHKGFRQADVVEGDEGATESIWHRHLTDDELLALYERTWSLDETPPKRVLSSRPDEVLCTMERELAPSKKRFSSR